MTDTLATSDPPPASQTAPQTSATPALDLSAIDWRSRTLFISADNVAPLERHFMFGDLESDWIPESGEQQCYCPDNLTTGISAGRQSTPAILLTARREPTLGVLHGEPCPTPQPWSSATFTTRNRFQQQYGYFEARIANPRAAKWRWAAWWFLSADERGTFEIDVFEDMPQDRGAAIRCTGLVAARGINDQTVVPVRDTGRLHTYGLLWTADVLRWYVDHVPVKEMPTPPEMCAPAYMACSLAMASPGTWIADEQSSFASDLPDPDTHEMVVAYLAAYRIGV